MVPTTSQPVRTSISQHKKAQISKSSTDRSNGQLLGIAKPKKGWLYVGSIKNKDATSEMIVDYLKVEDIPSDQITVEKLDSKGEYSSFRVGIPI